MFLVTGEAARFARREDAPQFLRAPKSVYPA